MSEPIFAALADDILDGRPIRRLMFCYRTVGCAYFRLRGGCAMCAFPRSSTDGVPVGVEELKAQLDETLARFDLAHERVEELDLFCAGSFLNDDEVPPAARLHAYERVRALPVLKKLLVESRPEYVTDRVVAEALAALGPGVQLEVAIGLESADDRVREVLIRKGFGRPAFEAALGVLGRLGATALVYVLLKPPGLTEAEALDDAVASVRYVHEAARRAGVRHATAAVEPVFVQERGPLFDAWSRGEFRPPWLWTVVELARRAHGSGEVQIGTAQDTPPPCAVPRNCGICDGAVERALARYTATQDLAALAGLDCRCRDRWRAEAGVTPQSVQGLATCTR